MGEASVQAVGIRVSTLDATGAAVTAYSTDALVRLDATPLYAKGAEVVYADGTGALCINYRQADRLRRYDLALDICTLDANLEAALVGAMVFSSGGSSVGGASTAAGSVGAPYGVSVELWSRHILNGDLDPSWPYVHWAIPRSYWTAGKTTFEGSNMLRPFDGFTDENALWGSGPVGDWNFDSTRSIAWALALSTPFTVGSGSGGSGFTGFPGEAVFPSESLFPTGG